MESRASSSSVAASAVAASAAPSAGAGANSKSEAAESKGSASSTSKGNEAFTLDGCYIYIKMSAINMAFKKQIYDFATTGLEECCDPLKYFNQYSDAAENPWATKFGRTPYTRVRYFYDDLESNSNPYKNKIDPYISEYYGNPKKKLSKQYVFQVKHFMMLTIRNMILLIDHHYRNDPAKRKEQYGIVANLGYSIKTYRHWPNGFFSKHQDKYVFSKLLDQILNNLEDDQNKFQTIAESRKLADSFNGFEKTLDILYPTYKRIMLQFIFDKNVKEDVLADDGNKAALSNEKLSYEQFKNDGGVTQSAKTLFDTSEKLNIVQTLFSETKQQERLEALDNKTIQEQIKHLETDLSSPPLLENKADEIKALPAASNPQLSQELIASNPSNTAVAMMNTQVATYFEPTESMKEIAENFHQIQQKCLEVVSKIDSILPKNIQNALISKDQKQAAAKKAAEDYSAALKKVLTLNLQFINIKGMVKHIQQLIIDLGNFSKPVALPQIQKLHTLARENLNSISTALNETVRANIEMKQRIELNDEWHTNADTSRVLTRAIDNLIFGDANKQLQDIYASLKPEAILKDGERVMKALWSLTARLELIEGYKTPLSPFFTPIVQGYGAALLATEQRKAARLNKGDLYQQFSRTLLPPPSGPTVEVLPDDYGVITLEDIKGAKVKDLTNQDIFTGKVEVVGNRYYINILGKRTEINLAAKDWILAKQAKDSANTLDKEIEQLQIEQAVNSAKIEELQKRSVSLTTHLETIRLALPKFDPQQKFYAKVTQPSPWWTLWLTGIGLAAHLALLIGAGVHYLFNRKKINEDKQVFKQFETQYKNNSQELNQIQLEIATRQKNIRERAQTLQELQQQRQQNEIKLDYNSEKRENKESKSPEPQITLQRSQSLSSVVNTPQTLFATSNSANVVNNASPSSPSNSNMEEKSPPLSLLEQEISTNKVKLKEWASHVIAHLPPGYAEKIVKNNAPYEAIIFNGALNQGGGHVITHAEIRKLICLEAHHQLLYPNDIASGLKVK